MKNKISWVGVFILALVLWAAFGTIPYLIHLFGLISGEEIIRVAPYSGMFGAADDYVSGFALIAVIISIQQQKESLELQAEELKLTRNEMRESSEAQKVMAEQQKKTVSLEVVMPFMHEIMSAEMREAIINLAMLKREHGEEGFAPYYGTLLEKRNSKSLSESEKLEFELIDTSRRKFVGVFHKMQRLHQTGVVDLDIVKAVLGPDHCLMMLDISEPLEAQIRSNYSRDSFNFCRSLYPEAELIERGTYKK